MLCALPILYAHTSLFPSACIIGHELYPSAVSTGIGSGKSATGVILVAVMAVGYSNVSEVGALRSILILTGRPALQDSMTPILLSCS